MIKPEFWEDDKIGECSPNARLLFIALWNFGDDEGYIEYRPKWIKAKVFPYDELKIEPLIDELLTVGRLELRGNILWVKNFLKHQKVERPNKSTLSQIFKDSPSDHRIINDQSPPKDKISKDKISKEEEKIRKDKNSSKEELQASPERRQRGLNEFGKKEINEMLIALKSKIQIEAFVDSAIERNIAHHCVGLLKKIGKDEFVHRLESLLADSFHRKNCNKIRYVYNNIKGFIEPQSTILKV